jgi:hypothetical protein
MHPIINFLQRAGSLAEIFFVFVVSVLFYLEAMPSCRLKTETTTRPV